MMTITQIFDLFQSAVLRSSLHEFVYFQGLAEDPGDPGMG